MRQSRAPIVLFRTGFFGIDPREQIPDYEWKDRFTRDQSLLEEAGAVIFHVHRSSRCDAQDRFWVAWCKESTVNVPQLLDPDFLRPYDLTMTYQRVSGIWAPYLPSLRRGGVATLRLAHADSGTAGTGRRHQLSAQPRRRFGERTKPADGPLFGCRFCI